MERVFDIDSAKHDTGYCTVVLVKIRNPPTTIAENVPKFPGRDGRKRGIVIHYRAVARCRKRQVVDNAQLLSFYDTQQRDS